MLQAPVAREVMARLIVCALAAQFLLAAAQCNAQDTQEPKAKGFRLELASARVRPDAPIFVNAMLFNPNGEHVQVIRQTVQFPREKLMFFQARLGIAGDLAAANLSVEMKDKAGAVVKDRQVAESLNVTVTAKRPLEEGPLVELEFRLVEAKDQTIPVTQSVEAIDDAGKRIASLTSSNTEVVVSGADSDAPRPAIGCFFFTH